MSEFGIAINQSIQDLDLDTTGSLLVVSRSEAIAQHVRQRLKTFKGEWFLNTEIGVEWIDKILGRDYDPVLAEGIVKNIILNTEGVTKILTFSMKFNTRIRNLDIILIEILTIYDEVIQL